MIQLSYISSVAHPMSTEELLVLLQKCLANNQRDNVTGMLIYGNDTFLQTLEGDEKTVDALYAKIAQDPRHTKVKSLTRKPIGRRQYSDWNMGFKRIADEDFRQIGGLIDFSEKSFNFDYLTQNADVAARLMDHYSSWDPLLRKVEENEKAVRDLKTMLSQARGCVEIATLVLETVAASGKAGQLEDEHLRLCDLALDALRRVPEMESQMRAGVAD